MFKKVTLKFNSFSHGQKRLIKAGLTGSSSLIVRLIVAAIGLISVPLTAKYLGAERFGLWLMVSTFLGWVSIADFGLANSLKNILATADGKQDRETAKIAVSSVFWLLLGIAIVLGIVSLLAYPSISWSRIFNVTSSLAKADANSVAIVIIILFLCRLPLSIAPSIYAGYQEGYIYNVWEFFTAIISVTLLFIAINFQASITILASAFFGASLLSSLFSAIHLFCVRRPWLLPQVTYFNWREAVKLVNLGFQFWFAQIAGIILCQTDLILVSQMFGAVEVAKYGVVLKLFGLIIVIQSSFLGSLWSAYSEAIARKDFRWVTITFKRSLSIGIIWTVAASIFLIVSCQSLVQTLINYETVPKMDLILAMAFTTIFTGIAHTHAIALNGLGQVKIQAVIGLISGFFNLVISVVLAHFLGVAGISLGTGITIVLTILIYVKYLSRDFKKIELLSNI